MTFFQESVDPTDRKTRAQLAAEQRTRRTQVFASFSIEKGPGPVLLDGNEAAERTAIYARSVAAKLLSAISEGNIICSDKALPKSLLLPEQLRICSAHASGILPMQVC